MLRVVVSFAFIIPLKAQNYLFYSQDKHLMDMEPSRDRPIMFCSFIFFFVCSTFVGIEIVHNVTSLASGQNNSPPFFWIMMEA